MRLRASRRNAQKFRYAATSVPVLRAPGSLSPAHPCWYQPLVKFLVHRNVGVLAASNVHCVWGRRMALNGDRVRAEDRPTDEPLIFVTPLGKDRRGDRAFRIGRLVAALILTVIVILKLVKLNYP